MATVTCTPNPASVGQAVVVEGVDFTPSTASTMTVQSPNGNAGILYSDASTDSSGEIASTDVANFANQTLTVTGNAVAAETVTIGAVTYTWRTSVAATANEVLVGASASASLDNLKSAINLDGTAVYGTATVVHPTVRAGTKTATTLFLIAKTGGTGGNSLASTETMTNASFGGATFSGGAAVTTTNPFRFAPSVPGKWLVTVSDGTLTASVTLTVFQAT